ncbi:hypothetical protein EVAR_63825_1 [Eumeta japonica]|uniref:Uncharacterized protein n=1 Tax=Eumeta variegata TaxID=151549 RepID=A0A4C1ZHA7_EUMVA|nr:hypothetical protein EVAR_63825_1 [Eumeta japonica]
MGPVRRALSVLYVPTRDVRQYYGKPPVRYHVCRPYAVTATPTAHRRSKESDVSTFNIDAPSIPIQEREGVFQCRELRWHDICPIPSLQLDLLCIFTPSGCSSVAIGRLRCSPLGHPLSLVCYCASGFFRAAFRSVGLRACTSVWGAAQCTSRGESYATFALVPMIYFDYRTVCTPSPLTVSAPRERSRRFTLQILIAILVISRVLHA